MNEEIRCITNKGKTAKNEWENDDSNFLRVLYNVSKKSWQFLFQTYSLTCLDKDASVLLSYKYLNKLIS